MLLALWGFEGFEVIFIISAVLGTGLFLIRLILMLIGGDAGADVDVDVDVDFDMPEDLDTSIGDSDVSFTLLSLHGILSFFMMFGWVGLALRRGIKLEIAWSIVGGAVAGFVTVWLVALLFSLMMKLQSSGTLNMKNALGKEGTIYLTIPAEGTGQARIGIQGGLKIFNAVAEDKREIKTDRRIKVVKVVSGNILVVTTV